MTFTQRIRRMDDQELLDEYDWEARARPRSEHEALTREQTLETMHAELTRRQLQW